MKKESAVKRFMDLTHLEACLKDAIEEYGLETVRELCEKHIKIDNSKK